MSRFKPLEERPPSSARFQFTPGDIRPAVAMAAPVPAAPLPQLALPASSNVIQSNLVHTLGFVTFVTYLISGQLNDWTIRLIGNKAYVSGITLLLLPVILIASGSAFRAFQHRIGIFWVAFLAWMLLSTPFSLWRGGSVQMLLDYVPRSYLMFFYIVAFAASASRLRKLWHVNILLAWILLVTCWKFGSAGGVDDRFRIPSSMFYVNSNELALGLVIAITQFMFLLYSRNMFSRVMGLAGISGSLFYMLKTGSRGCTLALIALVIVNFLVSRQKVTMAILAIPIVLVVILIMPASSRHRLSLMGLGDDTKAQTDIDGSAIGSRQERQHLFMRSLYHTFHNPLLGVGPNQFAVAENGDKAKLGLWSEWLGTHNSYTQVSSECGIPGFIFYTGVLVMCLRLTYRMFKAARDKPELRDVMALSWCLFCGLVVYAVGTMFFHMAYTGGLPLLSGMTLALWLATKYQLRQTA